MVCNGILDSLEISARTEQESLEIKCGALHVAECLHGLGIVVFADYDVPGGRDAGNYDDINDEGNGDRNGSRRLKPLLGLAVIVLLSLDVHDQYHKGDRVKDQMKDTQRADDQSDDSLHKACESSARTVHDGVEVVQFLELHVDEILNEERDRIEHAEKSVNDRKYLGLDIHEDQSCRSAEDQ